MQLHNYKTNASLKKNLKYQNILIEKTVTNAVVEKLNFSVENKFNALLRLY